MFFYPAGTLSRYTVYLILVRLNCEVAGLGSYVLMWKEGKRVISAGSLMVRNSVDAI
jgi:hypothetical protein